MNFPIGVAEVDHLFFILQLGPLREVKASPAPLATPAEEGAKSSRPVTSDRLHLGAARFAENHSSSIQVNHSRSFA